MQSMVRNNENEKAIKYLNKFARLLRTSLENSREDYVSVAEEIEALQDYISLQSIRFEGKFNYSLNAYDGYKDDEIKIPPMLLQPFVENAIYHGMKNITYKGVISIDISKTDRNLRCIITDNGSGVAQDKVTNHKSLAINITRERLDIVSKETGSPALFEVSGRQDGQSGTTVTLVIPYKS
jgi:LytS/YehU family sensor histidine kinase